MITKPSRRAYPGRDAALAHGTDPLNPVPQPSGDNSVNGVPSNRRAYASRDAALANGDDPLNPTKGRPAGV